MSRDVYRAQLELMIEPANVQSIKLYVEEHIEPGSFLQAVLENNLVQAFGRADHVNSARLRYIVEYIYNFVPLECWGSPEAVKNWLAKRGEDSDGL